MHITRFREGYGNNKFGSRDSVGAFPFILSFMALSASPPYASWNVQGGRLVGRSLAFVSLACPIGKSSMDPLAKVTDEAPRLRGDAISGLFAQPHVVQVDERIARAAHTDRNLLNLHESLPKSQVS